MKLNEITNANIMTTDWAKKDRAAFLHSISRSRICKEVFVALGFRARGIWMKDVSVSDRRSVKAQLAGRGDYRVTWWSINERIHRLFKPDHSLEQIMYHFHWRHHAVTLTALMYWKLVSVIKYEGIMQGLRFAITQIGLDSTSENIFSEHHAESRCECAEAHRPESSGATNTKGTRHGKR